MRSAIAIVLLSLPLLSACQRHNPYQAQSLPLPPAPPGTASTFDRSAYPSAPRDYGRYRNWSWQGGQAPAPAPWAGGAQLAESISAGLDQYGLRPALQGSGDLLVSARLNQETRLLHYQEQRGAYPGRDRWGRRYDAWGEEPVVRSYTQRVLVLQLELIDPRDSQVVWSGRGEALNGNDQAAQADAVRAAIRAALSGYPPY